MSKQTDQSEKDSLDDIPVEIVRILQRGRTLRFAIVGATITAGIVAIVVGVVLATKPPWWQLGIVMFGTLFGPSGIIFYLLRSRQQFIEKHAKRTRQLEQDVDPQRSSSEDCG